MKSNFFTLRGLKSHVKSSSYEIKINSSKFNIISADWVCKNKFFGEGGRRSFSNIFNLWGYILTVHIEKVFGTLSHSFLLTSLKKIGFGYDFIRPTKVLLESQGPYIINARITTSSLDLK